jgi:AcrR family transcriptional regulator
MVYAVYVATILTTQRIAAAARRLLDREGVEAVTMRRVANAVGITPMAVYRHYPDRAGLLNALADRGFKELAGRLASTCSSGASGDIERWLLKMADVYLEHALEKPCLFELMFLKPREGARRYPRDFRLGNSPTANLLEQAVREGMKSGYLKKDDTWEITFEMGALSHGLITLYLGGRIAVSPTRFRNFYRRSFRRYIRGIRS